MVIFVEDGEEEGRAEKAGGEVVAVGCDVFDEAVGHGGAEGGRGDAGEDGGEVGGLGVAFDAAVVLDEGGAVGGGDVVVLLLIFLGVGGAVEGGGHLCHVAGDERPVGGVDEGLGGVLVGGEPVGVVVAEGVATNVVGVVGEDEVSPVFHGGPGALDDAEVAVLEPGGVGDEDSGVAPAGCSGGGAEDVGGDVGEGTGGGLGVGDVEHEFVGEGVDVEVVGSGAPEGSGVAHPAEAFVALGAVGGDGDEVAALAPGSELIHLVEGLAGAGEADGGGLGEAVVDEAVDGGEGGRSGGLGA